MATPLKVLTALSASYGAAISGSTGLVVNEGGVTINNNGGLIVNSNGVTVNSGGANITGQLTANSGISGSSTLEVGGAATFGNNVTIAGDLTVNGTTTTINSTTLTVDDKNIILAATVNATDAAADGGGITLSGTTDKTFTWSDATDSWTSSEHMDLGVGKAYKLETANVLNNGTVDPIGAGALVTGFKVSKLVSGSDSAGYVGVGAGVGSLVSGKSGVIINGSTDILAKAGSYITLSTTNLELTGAVRTNSNLRVAGVTNLVGALTASAMSGTRGDFTSLFVNGVAVSTGGGGGGDVTKTEINNEYNSLRLIISGTLDANGHKDVDLTTLNGTNFGVASLHSCSVDVLTDTDGTGWTNDLVSVRLEVSDSKLYVKIDAPAAPSAGYRLIAVNEKDFLLV